MSPETPKCLLSACSPAEASNVQRGAGLTAARTFGNFSAAVRSGTTISRGDHRSNSAGNCSSETSVPGELPGRSLDDRYARHAVPDHERGQIIRMPGGEDVVLYDGARREDPGDLARKLLGLGRMRPLLGDGDRVAFPKSVARCSWMAWPGTPARGTRPSPAASRLVSRIESACEIVFASSSKVSKNVPTW